jgi:tRNA pseudouridine38-40 synthase
MRNVLLQLAFVGTDYSGWQRQKAPGTVQQVIESAISEITREQVSLIGCSRTDAGVHAEDYIANFRTGSSIPVAKFKPAIQSKLPRDIQIIRSLEVDPTFNARRNSYEKTYRYQIYLGSTPFYNGRWWQYGGEIDYLSLSCMAKKLTGTRDFSGFCVQKSLKADNRCSIKQAAWSRVGKKVYFRIIGDRFLHRMVRFLVGAQIEVAVGKLTFEDFEDMLNDPGKRRALYPAPPDGLYLTKVKYKQERRSG